MNYKDIRALTEILNESGLSVLEVSEGQNKIRIEKAVVFSNVNTAASSPSVLASAAKEQPNIKSAGEIDFNNISEIKAPLIGIFYSASSPSSKPFVEIGQKVKKGDTLCIIEAMKAMNEITSDQDGKIVDICAQNGQVVEYSQVLFKIF